MRPQPWRTQLRGVPPEGSSQKGFSLALPLALLLPWLLAFIWLVAAFSSVLLLLFVAESPFAPANGRAMKCVGIFRQSQISQRLAGRPQWGVSVGHGRDDQEIH